MDEHSKQLLLLGREHYAKREFDKADYLLRQVATQNARFPDVFDMLGVIAHSRGDFLEAERLFERAVEINPNYTEAQLNLMVTYNDLGKYDRARELYVELRRRGQSGESLSDPFARGKIANMHAEISQAYRDAGMLPQATRELENAIALCPQFADLRTRLANLYRDTGSNERAKEQLQLALGYNPNYAPARVTLGVMLLSEGDAAAAAGEFESVLAEEPEHRSAQTYLRLARAAMERASLVPGANDAGG